MATGDQPGEQIDEKIDRAALAGVFDLKDVFELVIDGFDEGALAQQPLIDQRSPAICHVAGVIATAPACFRAKQHTLDFVDPDT